MSFAKRTITFRFSLGEGAFGQSGENTVEVTGLRASVQIEKSGGISQASAVARIYGLPLDVMVRLTVQNKLLTSQQRLNTMTILAGDEAKGVSVCFIGTISEAWADMNDMPDVCFLVTAQTGLFESAQIIPATSYNGAVDVVTLISGIATQMGKSLVNNGVTGKMVNPYYSGAALDQLKAVAHDARINCDIDDANMAITIWPPDKGRNDLYPLVSKKTGMVGYPMFTQNSVAVQMLFDPTMVFGQIIQIESDLLPASGAYQICAVTHNIESEMPDGEWFTRIESGLLGQVMPII